MASHVHVHVQCAKPQQIADAREKGNLYLCSTHERTDSKTEICRGYKGLETAYRAMGLDKNGNDYDKEIEKLGVEVENENERCSVCRDLHLANYERRTKHQKEESKKKVKSLDRTYDQCTKSWKDNVDASFEATVTNIPADKQSEAESQNKTDQKNQAGAQKESRESEEHGNAEKESDEITNFGEESTLPAENGSVYSTNNNKCQKGASGTETYVNKAFLCAIDEQLTETKEIMNNSTESSSSSIPPSLTKSLRGIRNVEGFDVIGKNITIHVLQGHTEKAEEDIKNALNKYDELKLTYSIEIFQESDCIELHSESVGGQSISRYLADIEVTKGTIGCFLKLRDSEKKHDGNIYAVTCCHVAQPEKGKNLILFKTSRNDESKEFSKNIAWYMLNSEIPVDIALIPVKKPCDAFEFNHNECNKYTCDREELVGKKVQKQGAVTKLTRGEIVSVNSDFSVRDANDKKCWYGNAIKVKSTEEKPFSKAGDSGSLVTLSRNTSDETHQAVSIVFAGTKSTDGEPVSYSFDFFKAVDLLIEENNIDNNFDILSDSETAGLHESSDD